jgi:hypothetical protein
VFAIPRLDRGIQTRVSISGIDYSDPPIDQSI